jgi:hypothetical protein
MRDRKKAICKTCNPSEDKRLKNIFFKKSLSSLTDQVRHLDSRNYWECANCHSQKPAKDYSWLPENIATERKEWLEHLKQHRNKERA